MAMQRTRSLTVMAGAILFSAATLSIAAELTPEDYIRYYGPVMGSWKMTMEHDGTVLEGRSHWRLNADKNCLLIDSQAGDQPVWQSVQGYDVVTKAWKMGIFDGAGHFAVGTLEHTAIKPGATISVGPVGIWKESVFKDGKMVDRVAKVGCEKVERDQLVMVWADVKEDGKEAPSTRITLVRLPSAECPVVHAAGRGRRSAARPRLRTAQAAGVAHWRLGGRLGRAVRWGRQPG